MLNSDHAGDSFAFGVEELFEHEPEVQISDVAVGTGAPGAVATPVEFTVTPGDGTSEKAFLRIRK